MTDGSKSIADLLSSLLEDWGKFGRALLFLFVVSLVTLGVVYGVFQMLPRNTGQVKLGSGSIIFSQATQGGDSYLVVISPEGWQETGISVRKGDHLNIDANGRVHIDLSGLNAALAARSAADERIEDEEKRAGRWTADMKNDGFAPEDHYTDDEKQRIRPTWHWTGPEGIAETREHALAGRMKRCILPGQNYGALLGAIRETGVTPAADDIFLVGSGSNGSGHDIVAKRSGKLYFTVNDVESGDKDYPDVFFDDNIGFFYAKVTVTK
jgi:hypothetical protein